MASNTTLCANNVNVHSLNAGTLSNLKKVLNIGDASHQLTLADTGSFVVLSRAGATTLTLPAVADSTGFHVHILFETAQNHVVTGGGAKIQGSVLDNANGSTLDRIAVSDITTITLANSAAHDFIEIMGDGTNFYVNGILNDTPTLA